MKNANIILLSFNQKYQMKKIEGKHYSPKRVGEREIGEGEDKMRANAS